MAAHIYINISIWLSFFRLRLLHYSVRSGLINPFPLMQSKKLYPPHIMFHPASPTVMASQIGLKLRWLGAPLQLLPLDMGFRCAASVNLARL